MTLKQICWRHAIYACFDLGWIIAVWQHAHWTVAGTLTAAILRWRLEDLAKSLKELEDTLEAAA